MRCFALAIVPTIACLIAPSGVAQNGVAQNSVAQTIIVTPSGDNGRCSVASWKRDWPNCKFEDGVKEGHLSIVSRDDKKCFRVDYAVGEIGPEEGGIGWRFPIAQRQSATLTYVVRFSPKFDWVKGGKLPGLSGGPESVTGGNSADGTNGFSCRLMWRKDGRGEAYVYHKNQNGKYGDSLSFPEDFRFQADVDMTVRMTIVMNAPSRADGKLSVWIGSSESLNERLVVSREDIEWRSVDDFAIDSVLFETFHGGSNKTWAPSRNCWTEFSSVSVTDGPTR